MTDNMCSEVVRINTFKMADVCSDVVRINTSFKMADNMW